MRKVIRIFVMLLVFVFLFCSCQTEKKTCEELLCAGLEYGIDRYADNGYIFLKNVDESSVFFMSDKKKSSMYGENFRSAIDKTKDFAIYISSSTPYEIAIFECYSQNDIDMIMRMCYERADEIKIELRFGEWACKSEAIKIEIYKKYVIFSFTDSAERNLATIEEVKMLIR